MNWGKKTYQYISSLRRNDLVLFVGLVYSFALVYSRFALTICMIAWLAIALFEVKPMSGKWQLRLNPNLFNNLKKFVSVPSFAVLTLYFFIVLASGIYSNDQGYLLERLRIKLPFLILPFAFFSFEAFSRRSFFILLATFVMVVLFSTFQVGVNYLINMDAINQGLRRGIPVPTPISHIRYSLMLAFSILACIYMLLENPPIKIPRLKVLLSIITVFLVFFTHVLSVRSGLLTLYLGLAFMGVTYAVRLEKIWLVSVILVALFLLPIGAYQFIPSFRNRLHYAKYDISMYFQGKGKDYSDAERLISLQTGWSIAKENALIGVGAGDLKQAVKAVYAEKHPNIEEAKMPHNQLLSVCAGTGIVGLISFLIAFFYPLLSHRNYLDPLFAAFHLLVFTSFMMENTIENAVGTAFYIYFVLLIMNYLKGRGGVKN